MGLAIFRWQLYKIRVRSWKQLARRSTFDQGCRINLACATERARGTAGRPALLLDNFDHLVDAAPALTALLGDCANIDILVTSRVVLRVQPEHTYLVPPLSVPDLGSQTRMAAIGASPAVELFTQRARAVQSDFKLSPENQTAVAEICQRLDGLPLAIELAATRIRILQPHGLLTRLTHRLPMLAGAPKDAPARQQTLSSTIAWSFDLLSPLVQVRFLRLSVFSGGFTFDAAAAVLGTTDDETIETLLELAGCSLIRQEHNGVEPLRYIMLGDRATGGAVARTAPPNREGRKRSVNAMEHGVSISAWI